MPGWMDDLKVGDEVATSGSSWNAPRIYTVVRVTKTQLIIEDKRTKSQSRWSKVHGRPVGSAGCRTGRLTQATSTLKVQVAKYYYENFLYKLYTAFRDNKGSLSLEQLRKIKRVVEDE